MQQPGVLTLQALTSIVSARLDVEQGADLLKLARPCIRLTTTSGPTAVSQLGGTPSVPAGFTWPRWKDRPLSFLAQLQLDDLERLNDEGLFRQGGRLLIFYEADEQPWGFDPEDRGAWLIVHVPQSTELIEVSAPPGSTVYPTRALEFNRDNSIPALWEEAFLEVFNPNEESYAELDGGDELWDTCNAVEEARGEPVHQVLGWPTVVQSPMQAEVQLASNGIYVGSPENYEEPRARALLERGTSWRLLLQLDSDDELEWLWGDAGRLFFWIRDGDLQEGRYDACWCVLQCY